MGIMKKGQNLYRIDAHILRQGKETRRREMFDGTKAAAEERYLQLKRELREGGNACSLTVAETYGELSKVYLEKRGELSESHLNKCRVLQNDLGAVPLYVFPDRFEKYLKIKKSSPSPRTGKQLSNAAINRLIEIVRAVFHLAVDLELVKENTISKARFPRLKELPRDRYLDEIERQRLLNVIAQNNRIRHILPIVRFALACPSRRGELVSLRRENLDLINRVIILRNGTTKNDCGCVKPIPPDLWDHFKAIPPESEYLFFRQEGTRCLPIGDFKRAWRTALKLAGIADCRFHDLRATSATDLANNGTDDRTLMFIGNWKTRAMPDRYYRKDIKKMLSAVRFAPNLGHFLDTRKVEAL